MAAREILEKSMFGKRSLELSAANHWKDGVPGGILTRVCAVKERRIHNFKGLTREADDL